MNTSDSSLFDYTALLLVDPQNDFCPGGALPVTGGDQIMPRLSNWGLLAESEGMPILVSRDWHPLHTTHFRDQGGLWPRHCVRGTYGAEFHRNLRLPRTAVVLSKGMGETEDAYSAFQARTNDGTLLADVLSASDVRRLFVMGLATDYCVKATALDALQRGLHVRLVRNGCRAVNLNPGDGEAALAEIDTAGGVIV